MIGRDNDIRFAGSEVTRNQAHNCRLYLVKRGFTFVAPNFFIERSSLEPDKIYGCFSLNPESENADVHVSRICDDYGDRKISYVIPPIVFDQQPEIFCGPNFDKRSYDFLKRHDKGSEEAYRAERYLELRDPPADPQPFWRRLNFFRSLKS